MNKDTITASISRKDGRWKLLHQNAILPAGRFEINEWLEDRKAFKHNHHLKRLMEDCGCETTEGFIRITHAASINHCCLAYVISVQWFYLQLLYCLL